MNACQESDDAEKNKNADSNTDFSQQKFLSNRSTCAGAASHMAVQRRLSEEFKPLMGNVSGMSCRCFDFQNIISSDHLGILRLFQFLS